MIENRNLKLPNKAPDRIATPTAIVVAMLFSLLWITSLYAADEQSGLGPVIPKAKGEQCVEPTEVMRRRHYQFILHQRDETVHQGIRTAQYRFTRCIDCHVQPTAAGDYPRHYEDTHFCTACHRYSSVSIDCFQCHADRPKEAYSTMKSSINPMPTPERQHSDLSLRLIKQHLGDND
ncbi:MAG: hypothetical protein GDA45_07465 [Chromatiales bacterium]|nr:hypothetical protein [Chromatiales bacterium]